MGKKQKKLWTVIICFLICLVVTIQQESLARDIQKDVTVLEKEAFLGFYSKISQYRSQYLKDLKSRIKNKKLKKIKSASLDLFIEQAPHILFADDHLSSEIQKYALEVLKKMRAGGSAITLVVEWIPLSKQKSVDEYLAGIITLKQLKKEIQFDQYWGFNWDAYKKFLIFSKANQIRILTTENDSRVDSIKFSERDQQVVDRLMQDQQMRRPKTQPMRYFIMYGTYHTLGENHLLNKLKNLPEFANTLTLLTSLEPTLGLERNSTLSLGGDVYARPILSPKQSLLRYRGYLMDLLGFIEDEWECDSLL